MPLSPSRMDALIDEHFAYEATDNVDGVVSTLSDDVDHDIVGSPTGPVVGPAAARGFYEHMFADLADGRISPIRRLYGENFLVDESRWEGRAVGKPFGLDGRDRPLSFRLLHVMEFAEDERISREQVWLDMTAIQACLPQD